MTRIAALLALILAAIGVVVAPAVSQARERQAAGDIVADTPRPCDQSSGHGACQPDATTTEVPPASWLITAAPAATLPSSMPLQSPAAPAPTALPPRSATLAVTPHQSTVPAATKHPAATSPPPPAGLRPDGVPAAQVGPLVLNDSAVALWNTWDRTTLAGSDCTTPGTVALNAAELDLTTSGAFGSCAETMSKATYRYGIFEARIWTQAGPNGTIANWPAFWLVGHNWSVDGEIDVFEAMGGYDSATFHYGTRNSYLTKQDRALKPGWNIVDVVWKPQMLAVYYNGQKFVEWDSPVITSQPMVVRFDNTTGTDGYTTGQPSTLRVDYLRIWTAA